MFRIEFMIGVVANNIIPAKALDVITAGNDLTYNKKCAKIPSDNVRTNTSTLLPVLSTYTLVNTIIILANICGIVIVDAVAKLVEQPNSST